MDYKINLIQEAISDIIGVDVKVITNDYLESDLPDKALFCKMIDSWALAWEVQKDIYNKYQISVF